MRAKVAFHGCTDPRISASAFRVLSVLQLMASISPTPKQAVVSHTKLGEYAGGMARTTVARSIDQLFHAGYIHKPTRNGDEKAFTYKLRK